MNKSVAMNRITIVISNKTNYRMFKRRGEHLYFDLQFVKIESN